MIQHHATKFGTLASVILAIPAIGFAGTSGKDVKPVIEKCKESCITGDIGIDALDGQPDRTTNDSDGNGRTGGAAH